MTLFDTHIHSGGHSNSMVPLEFDVLKFSFLCNLPGEGHEDFKKDFSIHRRKKVQPDTARKGWCDPSCLPGRQLP